MAGLGCADPGLPTDPKRPPYLWPVRHTLKQTEYGPWSDVGLIYQWAWYEGRSPFYYDLLCVDLDGEPGKYDADDGDFVLLTVEDAGAVIAKNLADAAREAMLS